MSDGILFSGVYFGGPVSPLLKFYCIFHYSIHFDTWRVTRPSANHGPSCLTSEILRELVFPTWYCRSILFYSTLLHIRPCFFLRMSGYYSTVWVCMMCQYKQTLWRSRASTEDAEDESQLGDKLKGKGIYSYSTLTLKHSFSESPREIDGTSNVDWVSPKDRQIFKHEMVKHKL